MDMFAVRIAEPTAKFHSVTSDTPLKYVSGEKATYVKNLCHTAKKKGLPLKLCIFTITAVLSCS